ncbi:hypothetical protein [Bordetella bronchialis]|uniref:Putative tail fiber protein gp53-like C-terminal domain-containing protein n=1 Tax=Bordetella bronchialis TaxID=463025 RepID=A0ABM6CR84_9BORD|nr:hypothetical protein [Bordetella bronchialis]ANN66477.1 hypothetical protein BAU06_09375 [Bordetella bronchialis]
MQERSQIQTTPPLSGPDLVAQVNDALGTIATDFAGDDDPAGISDAYMTWADTANSLLKRRNAANTAWVTIGLLFGRSAALFDSGSIPTTNVGDILVSGVGHMTWDAGTSAYVLLSATESRAGVAEVATQTETDAGSDDARMVTPKKLRWGVSYSLAANGYVALPSWLGGLVFQWGSTGTAANGGFNRVTFPLAFPNAIYGVIVSPITSGTNTSNYSVGAVSLTLTTFDMTNNSATSGGLTGRYWAFGR